MSNRGNLLVWSHRSLPAPSGNHVCSFVSLLSGLPQFLLSTSHPRWPRCSGSNVTFVHGVLVSNRINIHMSAAPLSSASALSSLKLHRSTSLSTSPLSHDVVFLRLCDPCDCCSVPLHRCRRCHSSLVLHSRSSSTIDPLTRNLQPRGKVSKLEVVSMTPLGSLLPASTPAPSVLDLSTSTLPSGRTTKKSVLSSSISFRLFSTDSLGLRTT